MLDVLLDSQAIEQQIMHGICSIRYYSPYGSRESCYERMGGCIRGYVPRAAVHPGLVQRIEAYPT